MKKNDVINAVKRLERAGSEYSRATQKLYEAAREVATFIENQVPVGVKLPRGYYVKRIYSNISSEKFLCRDMVGENGLETCYIDGIGGYLHGDFRCCIPRQNRTAILKFAEDIANGLLDEIAEWLEARTAKTNDSIKIFEGVKKK